jgi:hypothetical protein
MQRLSNSSRFVGDHSTSRLAESPSFRLGARGSIGNLPLDGGTIDFSNSTRSSVIRAKSCSALAKLL